MGGRGTPVDLDTGQKPCPSAPNHAAMVSGRYWHHLRQEQPANEAADPQFQDQLIAK
jgi:hypothetical protein